MKKAFVVLMAVFLSVAAFAGTASAKAFGAIVIYRVDLVRPYGR